MGETDKRKIKKVNGYKVNHPFSGGNIAFAFFTLVLIALPAGLLFLPLISFPGYPDVTITGLDLIKSGIYMILTIAGVEEIPAGFELTAGYLQFLDIIDSFDALRANQSIYLYITIGQLGLFALLVLNSFFTFIVFIVNLIKGYLRHSGWVKFFASFDFVFALIFSLSYIVIFVMFVIAQVQDTIFIWYSLIPAGVELVMLIIICSIRNAVYRDVIFEADLEYKKDEEPTKPTNQEVVQEVNVHTITVTNFEPANTLRPDVTNIGDHEYSQDQNLIYANIPDGVTKLGAGAFANCLKLRLVSIPLSVKAIGFNCFFNCVSLERLNYAGTKEQWSKIARGSNWLAKAKTSEVICVDGAIVVNPYH